VSEGDAAPPGPFRKAINYAVLAVAGGVIAVHLYRYLFDNVAVEIFPHTAACRQERSSEFCRHVFEAANEAVAARPPRSAPGRHPLTLFDAVGVADERRSEARIANPDAPDMEAGSGVVLLSLARRDDTCVQVTGTTRGGFGEIGRTFCSAGG
jgi:hypothetical protein